MISWARVVISRLRVTLQPMSVWVEVTLLAPVRLRGWCMMHHGVVSPRMIIPVLAQALRMGSMHHHWRLSTGIGRRRGGTTSHGIGGNRSRGNGNGGGGSSGCMVPSAGNRSGTTSISGSRCRVSQSDGRGGDACDTSSRVWPSIKPQIRDGCTARRWLDSRGGDVCDTSSRIWPSVKGQIRDRCAARRWL